MNANNTIQSRCHEVMRVAVEVFPEDLRPKRNPLVGDQNSNNAFVALGLDEVWCIPWNAETDKQHPGVDFCIGDNQTTRYNVSGKNFDKAVDRVRDVFRLVLRRKELELKNLTELSAHL